MSKYLHLKIAVRPRQVLLTLGISLFFGLAWFLLLYGPHSLNFSSVDWIYVSGGDLFQHQNGWEWFRQEPWQFPLGRISAFGYPFGTYVSFTDSIPLLAMFFKLLDPMLPQNFQYLGLWELMSVTGQFIFGMLLIGEFTPSYAKKILGASLLTLSPILISRAFFHNSLTAHWILLAGIWFIVVAYRRKLWRGAWVTLFAAAILIHLYFVAMLLPLWVISLFFRYKREKTIWSLLLDILAVPVVTLLISYAIGLFSLSVGDLLAEGYGFYSWNLNGFFNPAGSSSLFGQLPTGSEGQTEGFSYLGLGNLLILPLVLFLFIKKDFSRRNLLFILPFIVISFVYVVFALSNKAFLNAYSLWDFQLPKKIEMLFALFRASGRFIWPVFYLLVLFGVISVIRNTRYATLIILVALVVQLLEVQPLYESKRVEGDLVYQSPLQSEFWQAAAIHHQHVLLLPAAKAHAVYQPFALYARQNGMTLNWGYFSRANLGAIRDHGNQAWEEILAGRADNDFLYIFWDPGWEEFVKTDPSDKIIICQVDGYSVGFSRENELVHKELEPGSFCTLP